MYAWVCGLLFAIPVLVCIVATILTPKPAPRGQWPPPLDQWPKDLHLELAARRNQAAFADSLAQQRLARAADEQSAYVQLAETGPALMRCSGYAMTAITTSYQPSLANLYGNQAASAAPNSANMANPHPPLYGLLSGTEGR